ncbi:MAG: Oxidoreductase, short-chain dehydrogenase/reductase family, partial [uncultured Nocardioidaceae bacterium]
GDPQHRPRAGHRRSVGSRPGVDTAAGPSWLPRPGHRRRRGCPAGAERADRCGVPPAGRTKRRRLGGRPGLGATGVARARPARQQCGRRHRWTRRRRTAVGMAVGPRHQPARCRAWLRDLRADAQGPAQRTRGQHRLCRGAGAPAADGCLQRRQGRSGRTHRDAEPRARCLRRHHLGGVSQLLQKQPRHIADRFGSGRGLERAHADRGFHADGGRRRGRRAGRHRRSAVPDPARRYGARRLREQALRPTAVRPHDAAGGGRHGAQGAIRADGL